MNKAEDRILSLEDKVENLDQICKEITNLVSAGKDHAGNVRYY